MISFLLGGLYFCKRFFGSVFLALTVLSVLDVVLRKHPVKLMSKVKISDL